jgi:large subunit GTPase 1
LRIPRRPKYTEDLTKEEFKQMENEAFLKWRRDVSKVEESNSKITITPYEKNIEVWK